MWRLACLCVIVGAQREGCPPCCLEAVPKSTTNCTELSKDLCLRCRPLTSGGVCESKPLAATVVGGSLERPCPADLHGDVQGQCVGAGAWAIAAGACSHGCAAVCLAWLLVDAASEGCSHVSGGLCLRMRRLDGGVDCHDGTELEHVLSGNEVVATLNASGKDHTAELTCPTGWAGSVQVVCVGDGRGWSILSATCLPLHSHPLTLAGAVTLGVSVLIVFSATLLCTPSSGFTPWQRGSLITLAMAELKCIALAVFAHLAGRKRLQVLQHTSMETLFQGIYPPFTYVVLAAVRAYSTRRWNPSGDHSPSATWGGVVMGHAIGTLPHPAGPCNAVGRPAEASPVFILTVAEVALLAVATGFTVASFGLQGLSDSLWTSIWVQAIFFGALLLDASTSRSRRWKKLDAVLDLATTRILVMLQKMGPPEGDAEQSEQMETRSEQVESEGQGDRVAPPLPPPINPP